MDVFEHRDYRRIIRELIQAKPKGGYGELSRLARHAGCNPTYVSQVLNGSKNFTEDQGYLAAEFLNLNERETLYFLLLVQRERSGSHQVKKLLDKEISARQKEAQKVKNRVTTDTELGFDQQAVFYSDWLYTAVHALASIPAYQSVDAIAAHLQIPRQKIVAVAEWLVRNGLCKEQKGKIVMGPATTFVDRDSPLSSRHHGNWRLRAMDKMSAGSEPDFFFTAPFSISRADYDSIRKELVQAIDAVAKRVRKTEPELMAVINLDLFSY